MSKYNSDPYMSGQVLRNKLGITNPEELKKTERDITFGKLITPENVKSKKLDVKLLKDIHKYIFQDVYTWAGRFRTIPLYKVEKFFIPGISLPYPYPEQIESLLKREIYHLNSVRWSDLSINSRVREFAIRIARIWRVLPFRDGNTRAVLAFAKVYAMEHGWDFDYSVFINLLSRPKDENGNICGLSVRDCLVGASLPERPEPQYLINLFRQAMTK